MHRTMCVSECSRELEEAITFPLVNPELCKQLGIDAPPVR